MKKAIITKGLTLTSSLLLVTLFLFYRIGFFDNSSINNQIKLQTSHNGGSINPSAIDTTKPNKDSIKTLMMSSSKVLILTDNKPSFLDSLKKKPVSHKKYNNILSSSKSTIVFRPNQTFKLDSILSKYDTLKNQKIQGQ